MTDYLEPRQGENEDALWEAARRLEERTGTAGENTSGPAGEPADLSRREESLLLPLMEELEALDRVLEGRETPERTRTAADRETEIERERGRDGSLMGMDQYRSGKADWEATPQGAAEARSSGGRNSDWNDAPLQAERLDQVFRRDSRRYDGGFFLY